MHTMDHLTSEDIEGLVDDRSSHCVSIYIPTHVVTEHVGQDKTLLKNLRQEAFHQLSAGGMRSPDAESLLQPVDELLDDSGFWRYLSDGLAIFASAESHSVYRLPISFEPFVEVGDRFVVRHLLQLFSDDGRFYLLGLSRNDVRVFEGTRHHLREVRVKDLPASMSEALDIRQRPSMSNPGKVQGSEGQKILYVKYFRSVDRALRPFYGNHRVPLVLAGVDYLLPLYRQAATYRNVADGGIHGNPDQWTLDELHEKAWAIVEAIFAGPRDQAVAAYERMAGTGRTANGVEECLKAAVEGRVQDLFLDLSHAAFGRFDPETYEVTVRSRAEPGDSDLLAQLVRRSLRAGGRVFTGEPPAIPDDGPVTATLRYS